MDKLTDEGLYDENYKNCPCFWGTKPADFLIKAIDLVKSTEGKKNLKAIDFGCGEGKNSVYVASKEISIIGFDASRYAIHNAESNNKNTTARFFIANMLNVSFEESSVDLIISTGSIHCLKSSFEVEQVIKTMVNTLKEGGILVFSSFNDRKQELKAHGDDFNPILLSHDFFMDKFSEMEIIESSDLDLKDWHPDSKIEHIHSITRILARKN